MIHGKVHFLNFLNLINFLHVNILKKAYEALLNAIFNNLYNKCFKSKITLKGGFVLFAYHFITFEHVNVVFLRASYTNNSIHLLL
jgi:hypothetical protein